MEANLLGLEGEHFGLGIGDIHEDSASNLPDGVRIGQLSPVNLWCLVKLLGYFVCALSTLDALGNVVCLVRFAQTGNWAAFVVGVCLMSVSSCVTAIAAAVGDHGAHANSARSTERGVLDADGGKLGIVMASCTVSYTHLTLPTKA